jgi:hypothetical protein
VYPVIILPALLKRDAKTSQALYDSMCRIAMNWEMFNLAYKKKRNEIAVEMQSVKQSDPHRTSDLQEKRRWRAVRGQKKTDKRGWQSRSRMSL